MAVQWTSADLEVFAENSTRYEIVDGELFVPHQPHVYHQLSSAHTISRLHSWHAVTGAGFVLDAPGLIFADDADVAPDVVWISRERFATELWPDGKLHAAPELVVEILSPGAKDERRDREAKLGLYGRCGVREYWVVDWLRREVAVYRRVDAALALMATLYSEDTLTSPLLPGFSCAVRDLFVGIPEGPIPLPEE